MCAYVLKLEDNRMQGMSQAKKDAFEKNENNYEQMKSVAYAYTNKRECSIQECVSHIFKWSVVEENIPWRCICEQ